MKLESSSLVIVSWILCVEFLIQTALNIKIKYFNIIYKETLASGDFNFEGMNKNKLRVQQ